MTSIVYRGGWGKFFQKEETKNFNWLCTIFYNRQKNDAFSPPPPHCLTIFLSKTPFHNFTCRPYYSLTHPFNRTIEENMLYFLFCKIKSKVKFSLFAISCGARTAFWWVDRHTGSPRAPGLCCTGRHWHNSRADGCAGCMFKPFSQKLL